jgi:hypothetical protein
MPSKTCGDKRPQRASKAKAKSSVLSQLSGLENVVFNDFIDDELDSEDVSEQRASASLPDSVPIESEEDARTNFFRHEIEDFPSKGPRSVRLLEVHMEGVSRHVSVLPLRLYLY